MPRYTLNIDDALYNRIKQAAAEDRRSIGAEMFWLIERGLEIRKEKE